MQVAYRLKRSEEQAETAALYLPAQEVSRLLAACSSLGRRQLPQLFAVAGGFLIILDEPAALHLAGAIRLRRLAPHLFVPVDARLEPALLDDERAALVRERGLVFLPGGRVLGYRVSEPLTPAALVRAEGLRRRDWQPLPTRPPRVERIQSIVVDRPEDDPEAILEAGGGADTGVEPPPRPDDASLPRRAAGSALAGLGRGMMGLGKALGWKGLAELGANWINKATSMAPRLAESFLGRQEAALRELLRQFKAGNIEQALRRALPMGDPGSRGPTTPYTGSMLPSHSLGWSLSSLLSRGGGPAPIWYGGYDVQAELAEEYRKAAELALRNGDARRAAFIYARLLADYRAAANALMQGGLFHDAGILYLNKLNDRLAAANAFEQAGAIDRALQLYRQLGEHIRAGDLLQRAGDDEGAFLEYQCGADSLARKDDYLAAADIMRNKAQRPDLARAYLQHGWQLRPQTNAITCGLRLAHLHADADEQAGLLALLDEARATFARRGDDVTAGRFFNEIANLAARDNLAPIRDDLRDGCLLGLAVKMKQRAAVESVPGDVVSTLLGRSAAWSIPTVGDAQQAYKAALAAPRPKAARPDYATRVGVGTVTSAVSARLSGDLFVGFKSGDVQCFRPTTGELLRVRSGDGGMVLDLATDDHGQAVAALQINSDSETSLSTFLWSPGGPFRGLASSYGQYYALSPWLPRAGGHLVCALSTDFLECDLGTLNVVRRCEWQIDDPEGVAKILPVPLPVDDAQMSRSYLLQYEVGRTCLFKGDIVSHELGFGINRSMAWLAHGDFYELAGINQGGLNWIQLRFSDLDDSGMLDNSAHNVAVRDEGYQAAALLRSGFVAGVTSKRIDWLRRGKTHQFTLQDSTPLALGDVAACFPSPKTNELLIVRTDGMIHRVAIPGGG